MVFTVPPICHRCHRIIGTIATVIPATKPKDRRQRGEQDYYHQFCVPPNKIGRQHYTSWWVAPIQSGLREVEKSMTQVITDLLLPIAGDSLWTSL